MFFRISSTTCLLLLKTFIVVFVGVGVVATDATEGLQSSVAQDGAAAMAAAEAVVPVRTERNIVRVNYCTIWRDMVVTN